MRDTLEAFAEHSIDVLDPARLAVALRRERLTLHQPSDNDDLARYVRRCEYDLGRRTRSDAYLDILEAARLRSAARWADPQWKAKKLGAQAAAADERRAVTLAGRVCEECGIPVTIRARFGRIPSFCPPCRRRRASRAWWDRHRAKTEARPCSVCGGEFKPRNSRELTCSRICSAQRGGAAGRWFATPHAVQRYALRVLGYHELPLPEPIYRAALSEIVRDSRGARLMRVRESGHEIWFGPRRLRYVLEKGPSLPVVVTVLVKGNTE